MALKLRPSWARLKETSNWQQANWRSKSYRFPQLELTTLVGPAPIAYRQYFPKSKRTPFSFNALAVHQRRCNIISRFTFGKYPKT
jgi:hypothetical protein